MIEKKCRSCYMYVLHVTKIHLSNCVLCGLLSYISVSCIRLWGSAESRQQANRSFFVDYVVRVVMYADVYESF